MDRARKFLGKGYGLLPDELFARVQYLRFQGKLLHLKHPKRYTEMVMWLKVRGRLERYSQYADKHAVREYIAEKIGAEYLIPQYGVWESAEEVNFDRLPEQFVLKATHGCEMTLVVKDKSKLDLDATRVKLDSWLRENLYKDGRELQYRDIKPRIVAEKYLEDESCQLRDYKFYCAEGEPKLIQFDIDRFSAHRSELLDPSWKTFETVQCDSFGRLGDLAPKPKELPEMIEVVRKLSRDFWFVRVDLYLVEGKIYFGELTFTPGDGLAKFSPPKTGDLEFGRILGADFRTYASYIK